MDSREERKVRDSNARGMGPHRQRVGTCDAWDGTGLGAVSLEKMVLALALVLLVPGARTCSGWGEDGAPASAIKDDVQIILPVLPKHISRRCALCGRQSVFRSSALRRT